MPAKKNLFDIISIGTADSPVETLWVKRIVNCRNISYAPPVIPDFPETETFQGMTVDTGTNNFEFKTTTSHDANINMKTHYLSGNGTNAGLRFPGGGINGEFTNQLTVKGAINADKTGGHSLIAAESIRVEGSYYTGESQGITGTSPFVYDLRFGSLGGLEYRTGTISIKGGNTILLQLNPSWNPVPTI